VGGDGGNGVREPGSNCALTGVPRRGGSKSVEKARDRPICNNVKGGIMKIRSGVCGYRKFESSSVRVDNS